MMLRESEVKNDDERMIDVELRKAQADGKAVRNVFGSVYSDVEGMRRVLKLVNGERIGRVVVIL